MIISKLSGGLGNQMFQYALGRRLALKNNVPLKLDISEYNEEKLRKYDLSYFNIIENFATQKDLRSITFPSNKTDNAFLIKIYQHIFRLSPIQYVNEQTINFHPEILTLGDNTYLDGYWQSEQYFSDIKEVIRKEFTVKGMPDPINESYLGKIIDCESVSVHVRRGDYVSNPTTAQVHGFLGLEYYQMALDIILEKIDEPHFFVFSDDPDWAERNIKPDAPIAYIKHNGAKNYEDLRLMSTCKHHIIANSSFSWWGAWLASDENKTVIGPSRWFRDKGYNDQDRMPENWLRV